MSEHLEIERLQRRHHHRLRYDKASGEMVGTLLSGRMLVMFARVFAPRPEKIRQMLISLRRDCQLSRGEMAAVLAVSECTVKTWERGTRSPSLAARRLIWLLDNVVRDLVIPDAAGLIWWQRVPRSDEIASGPNAATQV